MVERLVVTSPHDIIEAGDLSISTPLAALQNGERLDLDEQLRRFEYALIKDALQRFKTTRAAARYLGVSQSRVVRRLKSINEDMPP